MLNVAVKTQVALQQHFCIVNSSDTLVNGNTFLLAQRMSGKHWCEGNTTNNWTRISNL